MSNRREFITLLGGAAAWPLAARAQRPERMRRIGLLMGAADNREGQARVTALKQGLQELGWTDGGNIQIETRFAGAGRPHTGSRSRTSSARARRNRRPNDAGHSGAAAGNKLHSDRNRGSQRSCRARLRFELGASGREYHWLYVHRFPNGGEVARDNCCLAGLRWASGHHSCGYLMFFSTVPMNCNIIRCC